MLSRHFAFALAVAAPFALVACNKSGTTATSFDYGTQPTYTGQSQYSGQAQYAGQMQYPGHTQTINTPSTRTPSPRSTHKHQFTYFPGAQVYFDNETGAWFWPQGGNWKTGSSLPGSVAVSPADAVPVQLDTDIPYEHHDVVTRFYPVQPKGTRTAIGH